MGIAFDMELFSATILFLSRECFRLALIRNPSNVNQRNLRNSQQLVANMSFIPLVVGTVMMVVGLMFFVDFNNSDLSQSRRQTTILIYSAACFVELLTEPMYILVQSGLLYHIRVWSEGGNRFNNLKVLFFFKH